MEFVLEPNLNRHFWGVDFGIIGFAWNGTVTRFVKIGMSVDCWNEVGIPISRPNASKLAFGQIGNVLCKCFCNISYQALANINWAALSDCKYDTFNFGRAWILFVGRDKRIWEETAFGESKEKGHTKKGCLLKKTD